MGEFLQIRVIAANWNDDRMEDRWPRLAQIAFSVPIKFENRGLLEMVRALSEGLEFMKWPDARKSALGPGIKKAAAIKADLEKALADWEPRKANDLSNQLEDEMDALERACAERS